MFSLPKQNIYLAQVAKDKQDAITLVANSLVKSGYIDQNYLQGMLEREKQTSTYLGNGIAIPHGTLATKSLVKKTGVVLFQFPQGIEWGDGNIAYIVIGIAACSDEHLNLLRQLTHILSDEDLTKILASTSDLGLFERLFSIETAPEILQPELVSLNVLTNSRLTLNAINAGKLQQQNLVDSSSINSLIIDKGLPLGNGLWLTESTVGCKANGLAFSRASKKFNDNGQEIHAIISVSMVNQQIEPILQRLLQPEIQQVLLNTDSAEVIVKSLQGKILPNNADCSDNETKSAIFTVLNPHGLHARPSTVLVQEAKKFSCSIMVENIDRQTESVNAKSMMKLVSLGAIKGHKLHFVAKGKDAELALKAIGKAIKSGLGEVI